jgi:hypothetical protein
MLDFVFGFACGTVSTVLSATLLYMVFDRAVRPPSGG